jgi:hypothetical protein
MVDSQMLPCCWVRELWHVVRSPGSRDGQKAMTGGASNAQGKERCGTVSRAESAGEGRSSGGQFLEMC